MKKCYLIDEIITFDYNKSQLIIDGNVTFLRPQCCELLYLLIKNHDFNDAYVSFKEIGDTLWPDFGYAADVKQNIKDCVKDLRNSFGDSSYIKNIRKRGYRLNCNSVFLIDDSKEINIDTGNQPSFFTSESQQLKVTLFVASEQYKSISAEIHNLRKSMQVLGYNIYKEVCCYQRHTKAFLKKIESLHGLLKELSKDAKQLNSIEENLKNLPKHEILLDTIDITSESDSKYKNTDPKLLLFILTDLAHISSQLILLEEKCFLYQRNFYTTLEQFKRNERVIIRILNRWTNNPNAGYYDVYMSYAEKSSYYFYNYFYLE